MTDREKLIREAEQHTADFSYGAPLSLGEISIAYHSAQCPRCAYLARQAAFRSGATNRFDVLNEHDQEALRRLAEEVKGDPVFEAFSVSCMHEAHAEDFLGMKMIILACFSMGQRSVRQ